MIDRAEIFERIVKANALRREVGLPQRSVRETYDTDVRRALRLEYFRRRAEQAHADVLREQREKYGADYPTSAGGRQAVAVLVHQKLRDGFRGQRSV